MSGRLAARFAFIGLAALLHGVARADDEPAALTLGLGASGQLRQVVLPGPELAVAPLDRDAPLVLRVVSASPHGTAHRYDVECYGLEAGRYDLTSLLVRASDGGPAAGLPPLWVEIVDILPPGQVEPLALEAGELPRLGGYRLALVLGAVLWVAGLIGLLLRGRHPRVDAHAAERTRPGLATQLRPLVEAARRGDLEASGQAQLERLLLAAWRRRLGLVDLPPLEALRRLRRHSEAGQLLRQLEAWLHQPPGRGEPVDVEALLAPYADLAGEEAQA
jgi:hypothetical protein